MNYAEIYNLLDKVPVGPEKQRRMLKILRSATTRQSNAADIGDDEESTKFQEKELTMTAEEEDFLNDFNMFGNILEKLANSGF